MNESPHWVKYSWVEGCWEYGSWGVIVPPGQPPDIVAEGLTAYPISRFEEACPNDLGVGAACPLVKSLGPPWAISQIASKIDDNLEAESCPQKLC